MGTVEDWRLLRAEVERLIDFEVDGNPNGNVVGLWVEYLWEIRDRFVESAEHPGSSETLESWDKAHTKEANDVGVGVFRVLGASLHVCKNTSSTHMAYRSRHKRTFDETPW